MTTIRIAALTLLCIASMAPAVHADDWDKKTVFTFNAPVEIPGQVLLPGTYVFKLLNSQNDRNIVLVYNKDENHLIGTFLTIADYRMTPPSKPLITFEERAAGAPEAIKSWFYPGDNYGNQFVYPKARAVQLAAQSQQSVPSMPTNLAAATHNQDSQKVADMKQAELKAQKPSGEEATLAEVFLIAAPTTPTADPAPPARTLVALAPSSGELPKTASPMPLLLLAGLLLLAAGLGLRATSLGTR
ncbi:MAG: hypothetical protein ABSG03_08235 [Bryobacteraceae bacterium]|jgi:hypothetical protein